MIRELASAALAAVTAAIELARAMRQLHRLQPRDTPMGRVTAYIMTLPGPVAMARVRQMERMAAVGELRDPWESPFSATAVARWMAARELVDLLNGAFDGAPAE